jgi:hypothetical protein
MATLDLPLPANQATQVQIERENAATRLPGKRERADPFLAQACKSAFPVVAFGGIVEAWSVVGQFENGSPRRLNSLLKNSSVGLRFPSATMRLEAAPFQNMTRIGVFPQPVRAAGEYCEKEASLSSNWYQLAT